MKTENGRICDPMTEDELFAALKANKNEDHEIRFNVGRPGEELALVSAEACSKEPTKEEEKRLDYLDWERRQLEARLLAIPEAYPHVRQWMVDVTGQSKSACLPESLEQIKEVLEQALGRGEPSESWKGEAPGFVDLTGTPLSRRVYDIVEETGLGRCTDSGFGGCSWHVGVYCTQDEADQLIPILWQRFAKQIAAGMVWIIRHRWSMSKKEEG